MILFRLDWFQFQKPICFSMEVIYYVGNLIISLEMELSGIVYQTRRIPLWALLLGIRWVISSSPYFKPYKYRGSYMSAHVLLNLLNELGKKDKMRGLPSILSLFRNEFNKFNNTRVRMLGSIVISL